MKKLLLSLAVLFALLSCSVSFANVGVRLNGTFVGTATDINFVCGTGTNGSVTSDGSIYNVGCSSSLAAAGIANGGAVSMATSDTAVSTSYSLVRKAINLAAGGVAQTGTLANGIPGQVLTILITSVGASGQWTLTPTTTTGFTTLKFTAQNDQAVLLYVSDTVGWIPLGIDGSITIGHSGTN